MFIKSWETLESGKEEAVIEVEFSDPILVSEFALDKDAIELSSKDEYSNKILIQP